MIMRYCAKCGRPIRTTWEIGGDGKDYHHYCLWGNIIRLGKKIQKIVGSFQKQEVESV